MELSRKRQIKRRLLPGFVGGLTEAGAINNALTASFAISRLGLGYGTGPGKPDFMTTLGNGINSAMPILLSGLNAYTSFKNTWDYNKSSNQMIDESGYGYGNAGGISYKRYNPVDIAGQVSEVQRTRDINTINAAAAGADTGGKIGGMFGKLGKGIGTAAGAIAGTVTGIVGGHSKKRKAKRRAEEAARNALAMNNASRSGAITDSMQQDYANEYADYTGLTYGAKRGKDAVYTSNGETFQQPNARVAGLETIRNPRTGNATIVKDGKPGVDGPLANLKGEDLVLGNDIDWRDGKTFTEKALIPGLIIENINKSKGGHLSSLSKLTKELNKKMANNILDDLANQQALQHSIEGYNEILNAKHGKDCLPGYKDGDYHTLPNTLGMLASAYQYFDAKSQKPRIVNTYTPNKYAQKALTTLSGLRVNPYPIYNQLNQASRTADWLINQSGGLSGALKYLGRLANYNNLYSNIAKLNADIQNQNNAYRTQYATTAANIGAQEAELASKSRWYDEEYNAKSHAARQQGMQQSMNNFLGYVQQQAADSFKWNEFNKMYKLYALDVANRKIK